MPYLFYYKISKEVRKMEKVLYIYNIEQCNFYMTNGVRPVECGINPRTKRTWLKFIKEETKEVYLLWLEKCEKYKNSKK